MDEAKALLKLAKESNLKFQVGHIERFNPAFASLKDYKLEPMFIEVHRLAQFNPRGTDVSVILDLMIHDIDIILHLVKSNVSYISANGVSVLSDTPDIANVRIEFDNGCVANLTASRISMKKMRKMRIFQKDAYVGIDFLEKKTEIIKQNMPGDKNVFTFDIDTGKGKKTVAIANPAVPELNAMKEELVAFKEAIENNTETAVTVVDGFRAMETAHQILDKNRQECALINIETATNKYQPVYSCRCTRGGDHLDPVFIISARSSIIFLLMFLRDSISAFFCIRSAGWVFIFSPALITSFTRNQGLRRFSKRLP